MNHGLLRALAISALLAGCGGSQLSEEDTALAMAAMSSGVNHAELAASASASGGSVSATATCTGGGTVAIAGDWTSDESFSIHLTFHGCREGNVTVDGELHYQATSSTSSVSMSMSGELSFSGQVEGDCEVDIDIAASGTALTITGSMCGHDASAQ